MTENRKLGEKKTDLRKQYSRFAYLCRFCTDADFDKKQTCISTCCLCAIVPTWPPHNACKFVKTIHLHTV